MIVRAAPEGQDKDDDERYDPLGEYEDNVTQGITGGMDPDSPRPEEDEKD